MDVIVAPNWWALTLRGICAILFGALALAVPGLTIAALVLAFAVYALVDGVFSLTSGYRHYRDQRPWGMMMVMGIVALCVAAFAFLWPGFTALAMLYFFAGWLIARGVMEIVAAIQLRKEIRNEWWLAFAGLLSVVAGIATAMYPGVSGILLMTLLGVGALLYGGALLGLSFRLRSLGGLVPPVTRERFRRDERAA